MGSECLLALYHKYRVARVPPPDLGAAYDWG